MSNLSSFFVIRHGDYSPRGELTSEGQRKMRDLGDKIKSIVEDSSVFILTSPEQRAVESSCVLADCLDCEIEETYELSEDNFEFYPETWKKIIKKYQDKSEALILVTHKPLISGTLPYSRFSKEFEGDRLEIRELEKAEGIYFDLSNKTYSKIK